MNRFRHPSKARLTAALLVFGAIATLNHRADAVIVTAGEMIVDLRAADLQGGSMSWVNQAAGANSVGDFTDSDASLLNIATDINGQSVVLAIEGGVANALLSTNNAPASVLGNETRSVEAWVLSTELSGSQGVVSWGARGTNDQMSRFSYNTGGNGLLSAWFNDTGWTDAGSLVSNDWAHVTWTYDGDATLGYVNGVLVATVDQPSNLATPESLITVGAAPGASTDAFKGYLADIRVHTGVLTAGQVLNNFNEGIGGGEGLACDLNGDGDCDSADFATLRDNLFTTGSSADGDVNRDGVIDLLDYRLFKDDPSRVIGIIGSGEAGSTGAAPEPGCLLCLAVAGLTLGAVRAPRRQA